MISNFARAERFDPVTVNLQWKQHLLFLNIFICWSFIITLKYITFLCEDSFGNWASILYNLFQPSIYLSVILTFSLYLLGIFTCVCYYDLSLEWPFVNPNRYWYIIPPMYLCIYLWKRYIYLRNVCLDTYMYSANMFSLTLCIIDFIENVL